MSEQQDLRAMTARAAAFESALRIRIWNDCRAANMKQDVAIATVARAIAEIEQGVASVLEALA